MNLFVWIVLAIGNFAYQFLNDHNWGVAFERTWFQGAALLLAWMWRHKWTKHMEQE